MILRILLQSLVKPQLRLALAVGCRDLYKYFTWEMNSHKWSGRGHNFIEQLFSNPYSKVSGSYDKTYAPWDESGRK